MTFPDAIDSFPTRAEILGEDTDNPRTLADNDHAQMHADLGAAITAVETDVAAIYNQIITVEDDDCIVPAKAGRTLVRMIGVTAIRSVQLPPSDGPSQVVTVKLEDTGTS